MVRAVSPISSLRVTAIWAKVTYFGLLSRSGGVAGEGQEAGDDFVRLLSHRTVSAVGNQHSVGLESGGQPSDLKGPEVRMTFAPESVSDHGLGCVGVPITLSSGVVAVGHQGGADGVPDLVGGPRGRAAAGDVPSHRLFDALGLRRSSQMAEQQCHR